MNQQQIAALEDLKKQKDDMLKEIYNLMKLDGDI
jgi:hypothetical protein